MIWPVTGAVSAVFIAAGLGLWVRDLAGWGRQRGGCRRCRHPRIAHAHYRGGTECARCACPRWRPPGLAGWLRDVLGGAPHRPARRRTSTLPPGRAPWSVGGGPGLGDDGTAFLRSLLDAERGDEDGEG
jgi:hypothetical protein